MRLFRGADRARTDIRRPTQYIAEWKKDHRIALNGTKFKSGKRWTQLWLQIDDDDVPALALAWLEECRDRDDLKASVKDLLASLSAEKHP